MSLIDNKTILCPVCFSKLESDWCDGSLDGNHGFSYHIVDNIIYYNLKYWYNDLVIILRRAYGGSDTVLYISKVGTTSEYKTSIITYSVEYTDSVNFIKKYLANLSFV